MSPIDVDHYDPPVEPVPDKIHRMARAVIGAMPVFSGAALELLNALIEDPFQKRRTQWFHDLSGALNQVTVQVEEVGRHQARQDAVLTAVLKTSDVALRTSDAGVQQRLIAVVLNTIKDETPSEEKLSVYLSTLSQMTSSHLKLLRWMGARQRYEHGTEIREKERLFLGEVPDVIGRSNSIPATRLLKDLESLSLIHSPEGSPWGSNLTNYCTMVVTEYGREFEGYTTASSAGAD
ncbi:hypothetical protein SAMN02800694_2779 [Luteibacter sp. UNCMF331Sha3.1]|uniref:hypothetical protein n=1 Tax=Luteibacter sp. UNCMF331Sha3.1 TaxID=1502760 RepID=UPI0008D1A5CE|nr:hypothetical protein [Luteibacter sp. UNCMF331Sha3.1]SEN10284.1 hypothetical protein SAMN02800694_2779 [Luteibacter sp. UNCMF331Sha3.1]